MSLTRTQCHKDKYLIITQGFDFKYSGRVHIYLHFDKKGYKVICEGFSYNFLTRELSFCKDLIFRSAYMSLYKAIGYFHFMCTLILNNGLDWFSDEAFDEDVFFREANRNIYK